VNFLIDMNLSPLWVSFLTSSGIEAVHWSTVGEPDAADSRIMEFAAAKGWAVLTHDLDFGALLAASRTKTPSVFRCAARTFCPPP
jgi:predicted nuclease of predicted toxin-antitoxin system